MITHFTSIWEGRRYDLLEWQGPAGGEMNLKLLVEFPTLMLCTKNLIDFYDNLIVEVWGFES